MRRGLTLTAEQCREVDRRAHEEYGIPPILLMEHAAEALAERINRFLEKSPNSTRLIFLCRGGMNGGDGFAAARLVRGRKPGLIVFSAADEGALSGETAVNFRIIRKIGVDIRPLSEFAAFQGTLDRQPVLLVDCLLGTGFKGPLRAELATLIAGINLWKRSHNAKITVISADVPSGLCADRGPIAEAMRADLTVTFACLKPGLIRSESLPFVGHLEVADIGVPQALLETVCQSHTKEGG